MAIVRKSGRPFDIPAAVPATNMTDVTAWSQIAEVLCDAPMPLELQLEVKLATSLGGGLPRTDLINYQAGGRYDLVGGPFNWDACEEGCVVVKVEMGGGQDARYVLCDARNGRFELGSQQQVRVSVARWLAAGTFASQIRASISPSDGSGDYLQYSAAIAGVAAAASANLYNPPGAQWFELFPELGGDWTVVSTDSTANWQARRIASATNPIYVPPWSPLPLPGSNGISVTNNGAGAAGVQIVYWVR